MSYNQYIPQKVDLTPRRHHGYAVVLFIFGTLFPPLAVAARFGIGKDFWLNLLLTVCGYIPGHGHNFYIQNIRNNKNHARTPKWIQRYGLVDTSEIKRKERKSQWSNRYNDRLPNSAHEGQAYAEGQEVGTSSIDVSSDGHSNNRLRPQQTGDLWRPEEEQYYGQQEASEGSSGRWHYPANFEDAAPMPVKKSSKKKKDRWARTEDAYSVSSEQSRRKKSKKGSKKRSSVAGDSVQSRDDEVPEFPEDAEGGLYGNSRRRSSREEGRNTQTNSDDVFNHQF